MALPVAMVKGGHFSLSIVLSVWGQRGLIPSSQTHCGQCCMHVVPCGNSALGSMCVWGGFTSAFQRMLGPLSSVFSMPWSSDCYVGSGMARVVMGADPKEDMQGRQEFPPDLCSSGALRRQQQELWV